MDFKKIPSTVINFEQNFFHPQPELGLNDPSLKQLAQKHDVLLTTTCPVILATGITACSFMVPGTSWRSPKALIDAWTSVQLSLGMNSYFMALLVNCV